MANEQNLIPAKKGEVRNPNGKPKGTFSLSTMIRELEEGLDWDKVPLKNKVELKKQFGKKGFKAMVYIAYGKALSGDLRAMEFIRKAGYGDKLDITTGGEKVQPATIVDLGNVTNITKTKPSSRSNKK